MGQYIVYILKSITTGKHYIGQTNDLQDRLKRHNSNRNKYTKGKDPWGIETSYQMNTRTEAVHLESYLPFLIFMITKAQEKPIEMKADWVISSSRR